MHYILVVMLLGTNMGGMTYQEFNTRHACEEAQKDIIKQFGNMKDNHGTADGISAFCEAKG